MWCSCRRRIAHRCGGIWLGGLIGGGGGFGVRRAVGVVAWEAWGGGGGGRGGGRGGGMGRGGVMGGGGGFKTGPYSDLCDLCGTFCTSCRFDYFPWTRIAQIAHDRTR